MGIKKADSASATTTGPMRTPQEMVSTGTATINAIDGSPSLAGAPTVQSTLALFTTENGNLDANNKKKISLYQQIAQAEADEITIVRHWGLRRRGMLHEVNVVCDGSKEKVQSFNLPVVDRTKKPPASTPVNLHQAKSQKPTTPVVAWALMPGNAGYMVQYATDKTNAATYSKPCMCTRARFSLPGQTLGATLYFRVLALDPSLPGGQTDYSDWVTVTVGA